MDSNNMQEQKDPNVYSFMMQLVQEAHGDDVDIEFLNQEADRLYNMFGDFLLNYFEPQLSEEQKQQFDTLIENGENQEVLMQFLIENINDLEKQIINILVSFRTDYIAGKLGDKGANTQLPNS